MNRVIFKNVTSSEAQVCVLLPTGGVSNFHVPAGGADDNTRATAGEILVFWWRDDGTPCRQCDDGSAACARHAIVMPASDLGITLGDGKWSKQTV